MCPSSAPPPGRPSQLPPAPLCFSYADRSQRGTVWLCAVRLLSPRSHEMSGDWLSAPGEEYWALAGIEELQFPLDMAWGGGGGRFLEKMCLAQLWNWVRVNGGR